jgi:hypothetical protein
MEAVVQVMEAEALAPVIQIPPAMLHRQVEVTVRLVEDTEQSEETIADRIAKFKKQGKNLRDYVKQKTAEGVIFEFDAQKVIDGTETEQDRQNRYKLGY